MNFLFKNSKAKRPILFVFDVISFAILNIIYYGTTVWFDTSPNYDNSTYLVNSVILFA